MCFKGIAKTFENSKYMKPSNESIAGCALRMFLKGGGGGIAKPKHLMYVVFMLSNN